MPFITLPTNSYPYGIAEAGNILYVALGYTWNTAGQGVIAEYNATTGGADQRELHHGPEYS